MYNLYAKINEILTVTYIKEKLGFDLSKINPETEFLHPAVILSSIFNLIDGSYKKTYSEVESIVSNIDEEDILNATEDNRCEAFKIFYEDLTSY